MNKPVTDIKHYLLAIVATAAAFASCAHDDFPVIVRHDGADSLAIGFSSNAKAVTRASHEESAALLGNSFLVYGTNTDAGVTSPVFDNYVVDYGAGTAGTSSTNAYDWEYVGKISKKGAVQSIKYWDFSASRYDFVAVSGLPATTLLTNTEGGLRIHLNNADEAANIYIANRVTATPTAQAATATTPATEAYKNTIRFEFRRLTSRMRVGFYETIPGYAVKDLVFYYIGAPSGSYNVGVGAAFPEKGSYTVDYDDATNAATVTFVGNSNSLQFSNTFGTLAYTNARFTGEVTDKPYLDANGRASATPVNAIIGTSAAEVTFGQGSYIIDGQSNVTSDYKPILPNEHNNLKMQLRVDYTLIATDGSADEIHVRDAYVSVPAHFLQWKPNYSYTYIFKIGDTSNGYTGAGGGGDVTVGPGRDPEPDNGGDSDPLTDPITGEVIPPYIPDPTWPLIEDPDNPGQYIIDPEAPLIPNPDYPQGPPGDQHDPSNPVPMPTIPDPDHPGNSIPDPLNPASLFPITFDAVVTEYDESTATVETELK